MMWQKAAASASFGEADRALAAKRSSSRRIFEGPDAFRELGGVLLDESADVAAGDLVSIWNARISRISPR